MSALKSASALLLLCIVMSAYVAEAAITCGTVTSSLSSCIPYATGKVPTPPGGCCSGIKSLNNAAKTTTDRRAVCNCLKSLSGAISGINYSLIGGLPGKCGVSIPYKISPSTNCNRFPLKTLDMSSWSIILFIRILFKLQTNYLFGFCSVNWRYDYK